MSAECAPLVKNTFLHFLEDAEDLNSGCTLMRQQTAPAPCFQRQLSGSQKTHEGFTRKVSFADDEADDMIEYVDADGDMIKYKLESGKLIMYVNGSKQVGKDDTSGIVTQIKFKAPDLVRDQYGWGSACSMDVIQKLKAMADRIGVPNNLPNQALHETCLKEPEAEPSGSTPYETLCRQVPGLSAGVFGREISTREDLEEFCRQISDMSAGNLNRQETEQAWPTWDSNIIDHTAAPNISAEPMAQDATSYEGMTFSPQVVWPPTMVMPPWPCYSGYPDEGLAAASTQPSLPKQKTSTARRKGKSLITLAYEAQVRNQREIPPQVQPLPKDQHNQRFTQPQEQPLPEEQLDEEPRFCPYCGSKASRPAKFCRFCGASIESLFQQ
jgi:hypothetical protein